jgi:hypothetical protein
MIPTNDLHIHGIQVSTPRPKINCTIAGCNRSFKNRSGLRSHIRTQHSTVSLHSAQPQPFNTAPNCAPLRPEILLLGSPPYSPLNSSDESEEETSSHEEDHGILIDFDQPPSPSPFQGGSTRVHVGDDDNHREPSSVGSGDQHQVIPKLTRIYHPVINGKNLYNVVSQF